MQHIMMSLQCEKVFGEKFGGRWEEASRRTNKLFTGSEDPSAA